MEVTLCGIRPVEVSQTAAKATEATCPHVPQPNLSIPSPLPTCHIVVVVIVVAADLLSIQHRCTGNICAKGPCPSLSRSAGTRGSAASRSEGA